MARVLALVAFAAALIAAGCGSSEQSNDHRVLLLYYESGGAAHRDLELRCHRDGLCTLDDHGSHVEKSVSEDDLDRLRSAFAAVGFDDLDARFRANLPTRDYVSYEIVYEDNLVPIQTRALRNRLRPLLTELDSLVAQVRAGDLDR